MTQPRNPNTGPNGEAHGCGSLGCAAWGCFGFRGRWYCAAHRGEGEAALRAWASDIAARLVADRARRKPAARPESNGQGALW